MIYLKRESLLSKLMDKKEMFNDNKGQHAPGTIEYCVYIYAFCPWIICHLYFGIWEYLMFQSNKKGYCTLLEWNEIHCRSLTLLIQTVFLWNPWVNDFGDVFLDKCIPNARTLFMLFSSIFGCPIGNPILWPSLVKKTSRAVSGVSHLFIVRKKESLACFTYPAFA